MMCAPAPEIVVGQTDATSERVTEPVDVVDGTCFVERRGGERDLFAACKNQRGLGRQFVAVVGVTLDQPGRRLPTQPFEQPPRMQAGATGEVVDRHGTGAVERSVQPEAIAELDHQRNHLALFVVPYLKGDCGQRVGIYVAIRPYCG